jgi:uncharacterized membrane protein YbhN (UPF0104 family)
MAPTVRTLAPRAVVALVVSLALVVAVVVGVQRFVGWPVVAATVRDVPFTAWLGFVAGVGLSYTLRVVRLWRLLHDVQPGIRMRAVAPVFFVHNALATLLPARLGEAAMPLLARRWVGVDWAATVGALAWWRLSDLAVFAALVLALLAAGASVLAPLLGLTFAACALPFVAFALRAPLRDRLSRHAPRHRVAALALRVVDGMPSRIGALGADLALASLAWLAKVGGFAILVHGALAAAHAGGTNALAAATTHLPAALPPWPLLAAAGLAGDASGALPLPTLGGIGPFEAGVVLGLTALDVDAKTALAIGITLHGGVLATIVTTAVVALAVGLAREHRHADATA